MKAFTRPRLRRLVLIAIVALAVFGAGAEKSFAAASDALAATTVADPYVCAPCGSNCHGPEFVFDAPGPCPECGMDLVLASTITNCAILVFNGVQIIDFTGPYEVFGQAGFNVYTVAATADPVRTAMNMVVVPTYTLENAPKPDVIVVPGGDIDPAIGEPKVIDWIREHAKGAEQTLSVCNGAFILAETGLLDGKSATTFYSLLNELEATAQDTKVVRDERFVDNDGIVTSAGLSSGIDASLHVVAKMLGQGRAEAIALHLEYDWNADPDAGFARGALAHVHLERLPPVLSVYPNVLMTTRGDRDHWVKAWDVTTDKAATQLAAEIVEAMKAKGPWTLAGAPKRGATESHWRHEAGDGTAWKGKVSVEPIGPGHLKVSVRIDRQRA